MNALQSAVTSVNYYVNFHYFFWSFFAFWLSCWDSSSKGNFDNLNWINNISPCSNKKYLILHQDYESDLDLEELEDNDPESQDEDENEILDYVIIFFETSTLLS